MLDELIVNRSLLLSVIYVLMSIYSYLGFPILAGWIFLFSPKYLSTNILILHIVLVFVAKTRLWARRIEAGANVIESLQALHCSPFRRIR